MSLLLLMTFFKTRFARAPSNFDDKLRRLPGRLFCGISQVQKKRLAVCLMTRTRSRRHEHQIAPLESTRGRSLQPLKLKTQDEEDAHRLCMALATPDPDVQLIFSCCLVPRSG